MAQGTGTISIFGAKWSQSGLDAFVTAAALQTLGEDGSFQTVDVINGEGVRVNRTYFGPEKRITAEFVLLVGESPIDDLSSLKEAVVDPDIGTVVTITAASAAIFEGTWNYNGKHSVRAINRGHVVMTLELEQVGEETNRSTSLALQS